MKEYKIALMGAGGVGKTSMIKQFVENSFDEMYEPTIEEIHRKTLKYKEQQCMVEIADTAGMEQFAQMRDVYIRNSDGFILVYSIVDYTTYEDIKTIREQIVNFKISEQVPIVLVGNKRDLADESRVVEKHMGEELAAKWPNCRFIETFARNHGEIDSVFIQCLDTIEEFELRKKNRVKTLHKEASDKKKSSGKCTVM